MRRKTGFYLSMLILLLAAVTPAAGAPDSGVLLTVGQAVEMVIKTYPAIQQAEEAAQAAGARVEQSRSSYYPTVAVDAAYSRIHPIPYMPFNGAVFELAPADNYDAHVGLRYNLLDFGKTSAQLNLSRSQREASLDNIEIVKTGLAFQAIKIFYSTLYLERSLQVQDDEIKVLQDHLEVIGKKVRAGTATDFDKLTTQVRVALAQNRRIDLENMRRKQVISLVMLTGGTPGKDVRLQGEFDKAAVSVDGDHLLASALQERREIKMARNMEESARRQHDLSRYGNKPVVNLGLLYGIKNGYEPDLTQGIKNWVAGAQLNFPVIDGFRTRNQEREAQANLNAAQDREQEAEKQVTAEVEQSISDLQASADKLKAVELQVRLAETALEQAKIRYEAGVITNLDLLDSENSLSQAKLMQLEAAYNYSLSKYALKKATGGNLMAELP